MKNRLEEILNKVFERRLSPEEAFRILRDYPYQDLGFAKIDHHRELRRGFPEIIYGPGKTEEQIIKIATEILDKGSNLLITKVELHIFEKIKKKITKIRYNSLAKTIYLKQKKPPPGKGKIVIITAGTSDIAVAEEACVTCDILGNEFEKISSPIPIIDDGFTIIPRRAKEICEKIIQNDIKLPLSCVTR